MTNKIAVAYHNPSKAAPDDIFVRKVPWDGNLNILRGSKVISVFLLYENPVGNPVRTEFTGADECSIAFVPAGADGKRGMQVAAYNRTPDTGRRDTFFESLAPNDPVDGVFGEDAPAGLQRAFVEAMPVRFITVGNPANLTDLQQRALDHPDTQSGT